MSSGDDEDPGPNPPSVQERSGALADPDDAVGYKRPPKSHRFRKGRTGNPSGRPKKTHSRREIVQRVLLEERRVDLTGSGRPRKCTVLELAVLRLRQGALESRPRACKAYRALDARFGVQETPKRIGVLVIPEIASPELWFELFGAKD